MRTRFIILFSLFCLLTVAENNEYYALTQKGTSVKYSIKYRNKISGYFVSSVQETVEENNKITITYLGTSLDKKGKPSKAAALAGAADGYLSSIQIENDIYFMTQDLGIAYGGDERSGYILKIPNTLDIGNEIEGGTLQFINRYALTPSSRNELVYKDFKVIEEIDLTTSAGTFRCLKVIGNVSGRFQGMNINDNQIWFIAKGIGIIREELNYMGPKNTIVVEAHEVIGL